LEPVVESVRSMGRRVPKLGARSGRKGNVVNIEWEII
jgi:hypothetical protein